MTYNPASEAKFLFELLDIDFELSVVSVDITETVSDTFVINLTLAGKDKLRNLHLDEKCIILARSIAVKGPYETAFWDPRRDGHIKDYWK